MRVDQGGQPSPRDAEPGSLAPTPATAERDLQSPGGEASRLSPRQKY